MRSAVNRHIEDNRLKIAYQECTDELAQRTVLTNPLPVVFKRIHDSFTAQMCTSVNYT